MSKAEPYLDHLTSCSPCYRDFLQLQAQYRQRRTRMIFAVAASVLIVAALATWIVIRRHDSQLLAQSAVIDLRDRSTARGTEPPPNEPPIEIGRNVSQLDVYLPLGSSDGPYDIRIVTAQGEAVFTGAGVAKVREGITSLTVDAHLSSISPGPYTLQLRKFGSEWNSFPLRVP